MFYKMAIEILKITIIRWIFFQRAGNKSSFSLNTFSSLFTVCKAALTLTLLVVKDEIAKMQFSVFLSYVIHL